MIVLLIIIFIGFYIIANKSPQLVFALSFSMYVLGSQIKKLLPVSILAFSSILLLLAFFAYFLKNKKVYIGKLQGIFLLFVIVIVVSIRYSLNLPYGLRKALIFSFFDTPIVFLMPIIFSNLSELKSLKRVFAITSLINLVFATILFLVNRASSRFGGLQEPIVAGQVLGFTLLLLFLDYTKEIRTIKKFIIILLSLCSFFLLITTGTRGALISVVISFIFYFWFTKAHDIKNILKKTKAALLGGWFLVFVLLIMGVLVENYIPFDVQERFIFLVNSIKRDNFEYQEGRIDYYSAAVRTFFEYPIFGVGIGGFKEVCPLDIQPWPARIDPKLPVYPHNIFLEIAAELGIVGLVIFLYLLLSSVKTIVRIRKMTAINKDESVIFSIVLFIYGISLANFSLDMPQMILLWYGFGLIGILDKIIRQERKVYKWNGSQSKCNNTSV